MEKEQMGLVVEQGGRKASEGEIYYSSSSRLPATFHPGGHVSLGMPTREASVWDAALPDPLLSLFIIHFNLCTALAENLSKKRWEGERMTCFDKTQLTVHYEICHTAFVVIQTEASAQGQRRHAEMAIRAINLTK
ncbi:hypothetical protein DPX16_18901 [Anabarilius grahami]|uniref:Uncharacterized protein n=1 Tax=Anabarilius grahami TaxID=495550 RepID=A0A3N0YLN2_ANAGA|nr:hypothetical protein DPX16_18901 [Anabarilius grahami]